jgi:hypothetical protein
MKGLECPLKYAGKTGRIFYVRYKEHSHAIRSKSSNSGYSNHILNTGHTYGTTTDTTDFIMTPEEYHIYKIIGTIHI